MSKPSGFSSLLSLRSLPVPLISPVAPLNPTWVLSTDYDSYSVVYSCTDVLGVFHLDYGWILSRSASLPPDVLHRGEELLHHLGVDTSKMQEVEQDCEEEGSITFSQSGLSMT